MFFCIHFGPINKCKTMSKRQQEEKCGKIEASDEFGVEDCQSVFNSQVRHSDANTNTSIEKT